ncbi:hypothetical protein [Kitasatospora sp. NBC_01266]|uniref:hypothetical protein n=1 Tax=Kitasatospora sp. NBC_01266 TaxID=2903572 RepID=UPI002E35E42F|nr:hypothetical protein [Kitasatospora sp. NBC_01266]
MSEEKQPAVRRIDLSLAQVAASALAAVVGAVLASELGVYGTIIGAAVVSIGATTGGAVFQHLFRRTGQQLREATERGPGNAVNELRQVPLTDTAPLPTAWHAEADRAGRADWNDSGVFRARRRWTWRTYAAVSALVFALAMAPILIVELATGQTVHSMTTGQDGGGTSIFPSGGGKRVEPSPGRPAGADPAAPPSPSGTGTPSRPAGSPSGSPSSSASPSDGARTPSPSPTPSASAGSPTPTPTPTPTPSASSSSTRGTDVGADAATGAATPANPPASP